MPRSSADSKEPVAQGAQVQSAADKFPVVHALVAGDIKGVYAPKGLKASEELAVQTNPVLIKHLGLGVYRPKDKDVQAVLYNPNKISLEQLQKADKEDKLTSILQPVTKFLGQNPGGPSSIGDGPTGGLTGNQTSQDQPTNAPSSEPVQVMPRPTFGAEAQRMAAEMRSKNFAPAAPTAGPVPGGGTILNGLLKRAQ